MTSTTVTKIEVIKQQLAIVTNPEQKKMFKGLLLKLEAQLTTEEISKEPEK